MTDVALEFVFERRRYGHTTFTWAWIRDGDELISLGDPWPCLTPKRAELEGTARRVLAGPAGKSRNCVERE